jgi:hypothetical protein
MDIVVGKRPPLLWPGHALDSSARVPTASEQDQTFLPPSIVRSGLWRRVRDPGAFGSTLRSYCMQIRCGRQSASARSCIPSRHGIARGNVTAAVGSGVCLLASEVFRDECARRRRSMTDNEEPLPLVSTKLCASSKGNPRYTQFCVLSSDGAGPHRAPSIIFRG